MTGIKKKDALIFSGIGMILLIFSCTTSRHPASTITYPVRDSSQSLSIVQTDSLFIAGIKEKLLGNSQKAIETFRAFLKLRPDNATANFEIAQQYLNLKKPDSALSYAQEAASLDSNNRWILQTYADILAHQKKYASAAKVFHRLSSRYPHQQAFSYQEAVMRSSAKEYPQALSLFNRLEEKQGVNEELAYQKQRIYLKLDEVDSAVFEIRKLISHYPDNTRYYALLAQVYAEHDRLNEAIDVYQTLLKKYPDNPQAMVALGIFYKQSGNNDAFHQYMAKAFGNPKFDIEKKIAFVFPFLKYVEVDPSQKTEALALCRLIVQAHPEDSRAYALYGNMFYQCGLPDSALTAYKKALHLGIKNKDLKGRVYMTLGEAYFNLKNYPASDSCFELALQINPKDDLSLNNYSYHLSERGVQLEKALRMSREALKIKPRESTYQDTHAWVLYKMKKYKQAKYWMEKVLSHPGARSHPGYLKHYGDILYQLNEGSKARKYWKLAKEKGADISKLEERISKQHKK